VNLPSPPPFLVDYQSYDFAQGTVRRVGSVRFSAGELAHALFTTGRSPGNQASYGNASVWEFIHRASLIPSYIRRNPNGRLVRSQLAFDLDRSEKVGVSYALGQAATGIFCRKLLSIPFLMHIDRYASRYNLTFGATRKRADLFGYSAPMGWIVSEAKGRSNSMEYELRQKLFEQKRSVISIMGQQPALALGCVASFPPGTSAMRIDAFDPEPGEVEPIAIDVDLDRYMLAYYEPFIAAIDAGEEETGEEKTEEEEETYPESRQQIRSARLQALGVRIGLLRTIDQRVRRAILGELAGLGSAILSDLSRLHEAAPFSDGSLLEADWEASLTIRDWQY
jgi:hypothetical protein